MKRNFLGALLLGFGVPAWLAAQAPPVTPPTPPAPPDVRTLTFSRGGYLGIGIQEITSERAKALNLREEAGVEVTHVTADSPAERAGVKVGDVVLQYNGTRIEGLEQFSRMVRETPIGRDAKLVVFRNGSEQTLTVKIAQRAISFGWDGNLVMPDVPRVFQGVRSPMLGVEAETISGQLAEYFGLKENGVLVRSVIKGSAAEKAGIKAGDVILRVEEEKVGTPAEISRHLRRSQAGKPVQVTLMRDHKETTLSVAAETPDRRLGRSNPMQLVLVDTQ